MNYSTFTVCDADKAKIAKWRSIQDKDVYKKQKAARKAGTSSTPDVDGAYYGAIGGELSYIFTPNSIGMSFKVRHNNGQELDLTDYASW